MFYIKILLTEKIEILFMNFLIFLILQKPVESLSYIVLM